MDDVPLMVLAASTLLMLFGSLYEAASWLVPLTAPVGVVSAFLSIERRR
jgi:hypothetical protein